MRRALRRQASIVFIGVLLACGCCASSAKQLRTRTTDQPADADVLFWNDTFEILPDGARRHTVHQKTAIHTELGVDDLGDPRVVHDSARGSLEVIRAETTMRDGKIVAIKPNSVNETTPDALATAPAYADLRETVITQVGMEVGCTNELEYRIDNRPSDAPLDAAVPLHSLFPVAAREVRVRVPSGVELSWACLGCAVEPSKAEVAGAVEHTFKWSALARLNTAEADGPVVNEPRLLITTTPSWEALAGGVRKRIAEAAKLEEPVAARARALTEGLVTPEQRLEALWRFVARDLATVDWPLTDFELRARPAASVLDSSYGHSLDKAVLLTALLAADGIAARPLLVSRDGLFADAVPAAAQFSDVWLAVELGGETRWLDPTTAQSGQGASYLEGRTVLDVANGRPSPVDLGGDGMAKNQSAVVAKIELGETGELSAEISVTLSGTYSPFVKVDEGHPANEVTGCILGGIGGTTWKSDCEGCAARVLRLDPELATFSYAVKGDAEVEGRVVEVGLPWAPHSQILALELPRASRQTAMTLRSRGVETARVTLTVPEALELRSALPAGRMENAVGSLVTVSRREGNAIIIERTLRIDQRIITGESYPSLRALFNELNRNDQRALLFFRRRPEPSS